MNDSSDDPVPEPKYVPPRLGWTSAAWMGVMLLATVGMLLDYRHSIVSDTPRLFDRQRLILGVLYGWVMATTWMSGAIAARYVRWLVQGGIIAGIAVPMQMIGDSPYYRYVSTLGGIALIQSVLFFWLQVPRWRLAGRQRGDERERPRHQLQIGEVIAATTVVALLLAVVIRYPGERIDPKSYWLVLGLFWLAAPLINSSLVFATLHRGNALHNIAFLLLTVVVSLGSVVGFTAAQVILIEGLPWSPRFLQTIGLDYAKLIFSPLVVLALISVAGRLQSR